MSFQTRKTLVYLKKKIPLEKNILICVPKMNEGL